MQTKDFLQDLAKTLPAAAGSHECNERRERGKKRQQSFSMGHECDAMYFLRWEMKGSLDGKVFSDSLFNLRTRFFVMT